MTGADRLDIRRLAVTCLHAADHPAPETVRRRVDDLVAGIGRELGEALARFAGGDGLWLLRRVELDMTLDLDAPADAAGRHCARALAQGIARRLDRSADGVVFFADRTAHLARFLADLAAGDAWSLWYHRGFAGLKMLPLPMALRTAVLAEPVRGLEALASLPPAELARILHALGTAEAGRILDGLPAEPVAEALPVLVEQIERAGWPPFSPACPERLALALAARLPARGLATAARAVARLRHLQALHGGPLSAAFFRDLSARDAELVLPLLAASPELRARLMRAVAPAAVEPAAGIERYTPFGGSFMLLRLLDELPLDGLDDWPGAEGAPATLAMRALILAAAVGPAEALAFLLDPVWRELLALPPSLLPATLGRWAREVDPALVRRWRRRLAGVPRGRGRALPAVICPDRALDRAVGAASRWLLARLAGRLPGFAESSPAYLRANFLAVRARIEPGWQVVLGRPPLDVVLAMTGLARGPVGLPWLAATLDLRREG